MKKMISLLLALALALAAAFATWAIEAFAVTLPLVAVL